MKKPKNQKQTILLSFNKFHHSPVEPVYLSLFEVDIETDILSKHEKEIFREQIISINEMSMRFNQNIMPDITIPIQQIQPLSIITKLIDKCFNVHVKVHTKMGDIAGIYVFENVSFDGACLDLDFSYESTDIMRPLEMFIKMTGIKFNNTKIK